MAVSAARAVPLLLLATESFMAGFGGMAGFADVLDAEEVDDVHDYLIAEQWKSYRDQTGRR